MQSNIKEKNYFFVDESGDPVFYDRYGRYIVGKEGCSKILIIGFIMTEHPEVIRKEIANLQNEIINDAYLQGIPSLESTKKYFHASVDTPEVREKFFKLIVKLDFKAELIVARKKEKIFRSRHRANPNVFYDDLVAKIFTNKMHLAEKSYIYYEVRGNRSRQQPFEDAIMTAINIFEKRWGAKNEAEIKIFPMSSAGEPCLQIIDYINWAAQRAFVKRDDRFVKFVEDKISLICDVYDLDNYPNIYYNKKNKFDINKISPL